MGHDMTPSLSAMAGHQGGAKLLSTRLTRRHTGQRTGRGSFQGCCYPPEFGPNVDS